MKRLLYILLPVLALGLFSACEEQNTEDLQGSWELVSKPNENYDYKWTFQGTKVYIGSTDLYYPLDGSFDTCSAGNFILKNGVLTIASTAIFCNYTSYAGDWDIQRLDKEFLTIRRDATSGNTGVLWYEFVKIAD
tara:strand:- start:1289 stop:1693 length:405 start_codon:yes stop_codon:yes gene_type:complete